MRSSLATLPIVKGQKFSLNKNDWQFSFHDKQANQKIGLAADRHIKHYLGKKLPEDILVPANQYAAFDVFYSGLHIDIKTSTGKSVTISQPEIAFAKKLAIRGHDIWYMVCIQDNPGNTFTTITFVGWVSYKELMTSNLLESSQFDDSKYFRLNDRHVQSLMQM